MAMQTAATMPAIFVARNEKKNRSRMNIYGEQRGTIKKRDSLKVTIRKEHHGNHDAGDILG